MKKSTVYSLQSTAISNSEAETMEIATEFAKTLRGGEVVLLEGDLGSGKTTFVRGMARAFGIKEPIRSPTFTLMHIHNVKCQMSNVKCFVHVDAYRLRGAKDLRALGIGEYLGKTDTVIVIEWGEKAQQLFVGLTTRVVHFRYGKVANERKLGLNL